MALTLKPMHRTVSIDFGVVMSGSITCILDGGDRVTIYPGDVIIQRGTIHAWLNESNEWARIYFVVQREVYIPTCA